MADPEDRAGGNEGGIRAVPPLEVQRAEPPLCVWGQSFPEAGVLLRSA